MYTLQPIIHYSLNDFVPVDNWEIQNDSPVTLHFILQKKDVLGVRRCVLAQGSSVAINFVQARPAQSGSAAVVLSKAGLPVAGDGSMFYISLTATEASSITSGGVQLMVTVGGNQSKANIPYIVKKIVASPGF